MSQEEYIIKLEEKNKNLQAQIDNLTEMILLNKKQFGHSSEKTPKNQVTYRWLCGLRKSKRHH